jgi:hypothetical protein
MYISAFLPKAHAAVPAPTLWESEGVVTEVIYLNGTIETSNGNFTVLFDSIAVNSSKAVGTKFTCFFHVPSVVNGAHNVTVLDTTTSTTSPPATFTVNTSYSISVYPSLTAPNQLQEGAQISLKVNMLGGKNATYYPLNVTVTTPANTAPANTTYYNCNISLSTDQNGTAESSMLDYPTDFLPAGLAHTNYTGTYRIRIYENATKTMNKEATFVIGLTDATLYHRLEWVNIRAANYTKPSENATVTIKLGNTKLLSKNVTAVNGTITYDWLVPVNASKGSYMVTVANTTKTGTYKKPRDVQNFTVPFIFVNVSTKNLNDAYVGGVNATVYETKVKVASNITNSQGSILTRLDHGGNFTFKAFWKNTQISNETAPVYIQGNYSLTLVCQLINMEFTVKNETGSPMPLIFFSLSVSYLNVTNGTTPDPESPYNNLTNVNGKWILYNQIAKANFTLEVLRTHLTFNTTTFTVQQGQKWFNMSITCPSYNLTVHVEDARQTALEGYWVKIYEFGGGLYANKTTDANGNVTFTATFGRYKLQLYNPTVPVILNETYYDLVTLNSSFLLRSTIYHASLSVKVVDYLGQPIANAKVKLEREDIAPITKTTNGNGVAFFDGVADGIVGGDCLISVYTDGDVPSETTKVFVERNTAVVFALGECINVFGVLVDTSQFAVFIIFIVLIVLFVFFLFYRKRKAKPSAEKTAEKKP